MTYTCRPMCSAAGAHFGIDSNCIIKFKLRLGNVANVSETIRKPPLVEAKTASGKHKKYGEELFSSWRIELFHPAMWHVALE